MNFRSGNSSGFGAVHPSNIGAALVTLDRSEFFAGLFFLGCANGIAARAIGAVDRAGWLNAALGMFDVSAIVLAACASGLWLTMGGARQPVTRMDLVVGTVALALIAIPLGALSWVAVSGLALHILWLTEAGPRMRRGAVILLAATVPMVWSRLLSSFFAPFILQIDASLVAWLLGTAQIGNTVRFADDSGYLVIYQGCSSLANMSLAFLCWIVVREVSGHRRAWSDVWWCLLACGSVLAINVGRMSLMGINLRYYEVVHGETGAAITDAMILGVTLAWSVVGVRRELLSRA